MGINDRTSYPNPHQSSGWAGLPGVVTKKSVSFEGSRLIVDGKEHIVGDDGCLQEKEGMLVIVEDFSRNFFLSPPQTGPRAAGGDDSKHITILSATAQAHVVQLTAPNRIHGGFSSITFSEAGSVVRLIAGKGLWFPIEAKGVTLK